MTWNDEPIPKDDEGRPMFRGLISLTNDKREKLGSVLWFFDEGPFYAHAMDAQDITLIRRIGPCTTMEGAKHSICEAIEGREGISNRAGYAR